MGLKKKSEKQSGSGPWIGALIEKLFLQATPLTFPLASDLRLVDSSVINMTSPPLCLNFVYPGTT